MGLGVIRSRAALVALSLLSACAAAQPTPAPQFALLDQGDRQVRLSDFKGRKHVVLVFYWNHA